MCVFAAPVYQLQQEAPHPRRVTCTCEVRSLFLVCLSFSLSLSRLYVLLSLSRAPCLDVRCSDVLIHFQVDSRPKHYGREWVSTSLTNSIQYYTIKRQNGVLHSNRLQYPELHTVTQDNTEKQQYQLLDSTTQYYTGTHTQSKCPLLHLQVAINKCVCLCPPGTMVWFPERRQTNCSALQRGATSSERANDNLEPTHWPYGTHIHCPVVFTHTHTHTHTPTHTHTHTHTVAVGQHRV